jgi:hypothetical protein
MLKKIRDRVLTVLRVTIRVPYVYHQFLIALLVLIPLVENVVMAVTLYKVKLQTTPTLKF